jgi:hypothetical protein
MTAIALRALAFAERRFFHRDRRDPLENARARLRGYVSPISSLSPEEQQNLLAYDGPEVSGSIKRRRSR